MSLKAKLEAVIYAAEEPVTLGQLSVLFSADALEWKAEREAESAPAEPPGGRRTPCRAFRRGRRQRGSCGCRR